MSGVEITARQIAEQQYADALAALNQPDWPADHAPTDPYGRSLQLTNGDLVLISDLEGYRDLAQIAGQAELTQAIQVLVETPQGSDILNTIFGFDLLRTLAQPVSARQMRDLVRMCVVKALSQEPRIRQITAIAFVNDAAYLTLHPGVTPADQQKLIKQQRASRQWSLDVQFDTRLNDQVIAGIQGVGP